jgi:dTDP-4-amino-4,6-dideoxygalactose transaminase
MPKRIKDINDLAVLGKSEPAFETPLHVGRPNIGSRDSFFEYAKQIFDNRWLTNNGPYVQEFENRVAQLHEVEHCVAMCNGTVALEIAIRALGLEGEVIVPSYTFIATAHALHWQAITPVFADIDPETHNLDPDAVRRMITPRTTGIIGVHLWGRCAPVAELNEIADEYGLKLMFDAAHAFGCSLGGTMVGNFGECEILSFHATKFFNSFEGGAVLTNNGELATAMRLMRNFGFSGMDNVIYPGTNGKMIEIVAAMGLVNLDEMDEVVSWNQNNYNDYRELLASVPGVRLLAFDEDEKNNYQYVVIELDKNCKASRDQIIQALHAENILARRYFWPGCHKMSPYKELYPNSGMMLQYTKVVADKVIVLPTGTTVTDEMVQNVTDVIRVLAIEGMP